MTSRQQPEPRQTPARRSRLVPWGVALLLLGLFVPQPLAAAAGLMGGASRGLMLIATDLFRACFFVGIGCWIAGAMRNRRWKREAQATGASAAPPR